MTDRFSGSYEVVINAPVNTVAEYCRDPRRIFAGEFEFSDVTLTPEGVGTTAHGVTKGSGTEEVAIEYVEFVPDQRVVFNVYPKMTIPKLGCAISFANHVLAWTFASQDGGTRLTLVIVEQDPPWWQRFLDIVGKKSWAKLIRDRLARLKAGAEEQAASAR